MACNSRNALKGQVFDDSSHSTQLFNDDIQIDYKGSEVSVQNFLSVLSGTHVVGTPNR